MRLPPGWRRPSKGPAPRPASGDDAHWRALRWLTTSIAIGERVAFGPHANEAPEQRRVGMVFREGALFPHLTVAQNVAFGLPSGERRNEKVAEALRMMDLEGYDRRYPHQLSGGQQQRIALARVLAPDLMLTGEPFSSLDANLRGQPRADVRSILKERRATVICVTHDQEEALQLADSGGLDGPGSHCADRRSRTGFQQPGHQIRRGILRYGRLSAGTAARRAPDQRGGLAPGRRIGPRRCRKAHSWRSWCAPIVWTRTRTKRITDL